MFVGSVDTSKGTSLEIVAVPLKGTELSGRWKPSTDNLLVACIQSGKSCVCSAKTHASTLQEKLGITAVDAEGLSKWLEDNLAGK